MTILENVGRYYRITCGLCQRFFELNAANGTLTDFARMLVELGWVTIDGVVMCPDCKARWREHSG